MLKHLALLSLFVVFPLAAQELYRANFLVDDHNLKEWKVKNAGNKSASLRWVPASGNKELGALLVCAPQQRSWLFAVKNFSAQEMGNASKLYVTAQVFSNRPKCARVCLAEDVEWGGDVVHREVNSARQELKWQLVKTVITRAPNNRMVSVAFGMDYGSQGGYMGIGEVSVRTDGFDENLAKTLPQYTLQIPREVFDATLNIDFNEIRNNWQKELARFQKSGMGNDRVVLDHTKRLEAFGEKLRSRSYSPSQLAEIKKENQRIFNSRIAWRAFPQMLTFTYETPIVPVDSNAAAIRLPQNAHGAVLTLLRNTSGGPRDFQVRLTGDIAKYAQLNFLQPIQYSPDCPRPITADTILHMGDQETIGIQAWFRTRGVPAGKYTGKMILTPLDGRYTVRTMTLTLTVEPFALPDRMPISVFHWDYSSAANPAFLDFMLESRVNTFHVHLSAPHKQQGYDFSRLQKVISELKKRMKPADIQLVIEVWFVREKGWQKEYTQWLDQLTALLKKEGLDHNNWVLEIYDEILSEPFLAAAKAIKEHDPKVRIFSDWCSNDVKVIEKFAPYLDVWCPRQTYHFAPYNYGFKKSTDRMKSTGKPVWVYNCTANPTQELQVYRMQPWLAWHEKLNGCAFWTTNPSAYRDTVNEMNYGTTYRDARGNRFASRRWQMWQVGLEDYLILQKASEVSKNDAAKQAQIAKIVKTILSSTRAKYQPFVFENCRNELLDIIRSSAR